ncbi:MAG: gliding-motility protein MglA [Chloroflexi bacterium]|nr:gliding-motility protein MglA [Chloroflexota bacterium]
MALINVAARELHFKIVYYGPGYGGKTTNLKYISTHVPREARGELVSLATDTDRTLFFDFIPLDLGEVAGFKTRFHLYAMPGQVVFQRTRQALLAGVDGVVLVADSQRERLRDNVHAIHELDTVLRWQGRGLREVPLVLQYNKRDLPDATPLPVLDARLNALRRPAFPATASTGEGVFPTLRSVCKLVIARL